MFKRISKILERPSIYTQTETEFWNDKYISGQMLRAHLDPEFEGASRELAFIETSVAWIKDMVSPINYPSLLDVGCGPGLYAEKFTDSGYQVTGIDFSKRSVDHGQASALARGLEITYHYQNYLTMELNKVFDFVTMIYCDYGALSTSDRQLLMSKIYHHLKPGGKLLVDVFSMAKYLAFEEKQTWELCPDGVFWRKGEYLALKGCYKYLGHVTLEQISVITDKEVKNYNLWNTYFTRERLIGEAEESGFKVCEIFGDVAGEATTKKCPLSRYF